MAVANGLSFGTVPTDSIKYDQFRWQRAKFPKKDNVFFLLDKVEEVAGAMWVGAFKASGYPVDASWLLHGEDDPAFELGIKPASTAWIWVAVPENGDLSPKILQISKGQYDMIYEGLANYYTLDGLCIVSDQPQAKGRWDMKAIPVPKALSAFGTGNNLNPDVLERLRDGRYSADLTERQEFMVKMMGPADNEGVKEMLMKRLDVGTWAEVLTKFGKGAGTLERL